MPKKSSSARGTAQRAKPKTSKNFEVVRPVQDASPSLEDQEPLTVPAHASVSTSSATVSSLQNESAVPAATPLLSTTPSAPVSASARLAARRQNQQRQQQRNVNTIITAEHYSYVRKDLIYIAVLAVIMLAIIIALYFILGVH